MLLKPLSKYFVTLILMTFVSMSIKAETIRVATGEYPPWTSESLPHGGFINHIVSSAFELSDIQVEFHYLPWKRALEATKVGQFHASSFWGADIERRQDFFYSDVVRNDSFVLFHRKSLAPFEWNSLTELTHLRIGATLGYSYSKDFWNLANNDSLRVSVENNDLTNLERLINGEIDLFPLSELTGYYLLNKHFSSQQSASIDVNLKPINSGKDFILFSQAIPGNDKYLNLFNKGLEELKKQNKLELFRRELLQ
tara:strand:+ start:30029 stop:30790 length:762 start_codon:yes stop_codon:yes gene_type:complete